MGISGGRPVQLGALRARQLPGALTPQKHSKIGRFLHSRLPGVVRLTYILAYVRAYKVMLGSHGRIE